MIAVRLQGRLGNQMFQYAFAVVMAEQLGTGFYIDQYIYPSVIDKYFKGIAGGNQSIVSKVFGIAGYKNLFSYHLRKRYYKYRASINRLTLKNFEIDVPVSSVDVQDGVLYIGYFQSPLFFKGYEKLIKNKFVLKDEIVAGFQSKFSTLYQANYIVTVHIRRTDYQGLGHLNLGGDDLSLPAEYYKKAIAKFDGQNVHFVFVSDDVAFVEQAFTDVPNKTISAENEITDFQHLLNARACIISNSTFSWWGAWLNNQPNKIIYAPRFFLGWRIRKQMPVEIYPENWIQVDF